MEMKSTTVKLFIPHAEVRIFVTDEMIKDFKECLEEERQLSNQDTLTIVKRKQKKCSDCSWNDCQLSLLFSLCELDALEEKINELIRDGEQCQ